MELVKSNIENRIYLIRGIQVMLDSDLADLYNTETKFINRAVKRNASRFPEEFMFQLTEQEWQNLRFQSGTSSERHGGRDERLIVSPGFKGLSNKIVNSKKRLDKVVYI